MYQRLHEDRRHAAGYLKPSERDGCHGCVHSSRNVSSHGITTHYCTRIQADVAPWGICKHYEPRTPGAATKGAVA